ncbi:MAG: BON domain-containing protein [Blastocatellia bacterium]|nr:BON domain-containing protein [Blastocatellia bacterium]
MKNRFVVVVILAILFTPLLDATALAQKKKPKLERSTRSATVARNVEALTKEIRKELVTIPSFGVFDWLEGNVEPDGTVQLRGQVARPITKSDAERRVEKIEGVEKLVSRIEVLPLSNFDDQLRQRVFRALFNQNSPLFHYGRAPIPSIHIIIKNGRCTLKGVVANKTDADIAYIRARGVEGLFEVTNELTIEKSSKK